MIASGSPKPTSARSSPTRVPCAVRSTLASKFAAVAILWTGLGLMPAPPAHAETSLLVSSLDTASILRYDGESGAFLDVFVPSGSGGLDEPFGLIYGPDNNLYVTSATRHSVLRYDGVTGAPLPAPGQSGAVFVPSYSQDLGFPFSLTFGPDQNLYVTDSNFSRVLRFDGISGQYIDDFVTPGLGDLLQPTDLVFGPDGNLYVSSATNDRVLRYDGATGAFLGDFVTPGLGGLAEPKGLLFHDDALYVASYGNNSVIRYDATTGDLIDTFIAPGAGGLTRATGLQFGPDGNFYVTGGPDRPVLRYDGTTGEFLSVFVTEGSGGLERGVFARFSALPVPAPSSLTLSGIGLLGLFALRRAARLRPPGAASSEK